MGRLLYVFVLILVLITPRFSGSCPKEFKENGECMVDVDDQEVCLSVSSVYFLLVALFLI